MGWGDVKLLTLMAVHLSANIFSIIFLACILAAIWIPFWRRLNLTGTGWRGERLPSRLFFA